VAYKPFAHRPASFHCNFSSSEYHRHAVDQGGSTSPAPWPTPRCSVECPHHTDTGCVNMTSLRTNILGLLTAALLVLTFQSGAAFAGEKQYFLTVNPASPTASSGPFVFTFTNDGNSSFNSLELTVPPGWSIPATAVPTSSRGTATVNATRTVVTVNGINLPTGAGQFMTVTIPAATGTAACGAQSGQWSAQPWTGSSVGSGQTFRIKGTFPSTTIPSACYTVLGSPAANVTPTPQTKLPGQTATFTVTPPSLSRTLSASSDTCGGLLVGNTFTTGPVNSNCTVTAIFASNTLSISTPALAIAGTPFDVTVNLSGPTPVTVTLGSTCGYSGAGAKAAAANATSVTFTGTVANPGTCSFSATAPDYNPAPVVSGFPVYSGILNCGQKAGTSTSIDISNDWSYPQGTSIDPGWSLIRGVNKDGAVCEQVPFTFSQNTTSDPQTASFIVPPSVIATQKVAAAYVVVWAPVPTSQAWIAKRPKLAWKVDGGGAPIYMPALACVTDPIDFSTVPQAGLDALLPVIPNASPYNQEPLLSAYGVNVKAKMCVAQQGWTSLGPPSGGETLVQNWTKVIDQGDGFMIND